MVQREATVDLERRIDVDVREFQQQRLLAGKISTLLPSVLISKVGIRVMDVRI